MVLNTWFSSYILSADIISPALLWATLMHVDMGHQTWFMWCCRWNQDPHACLSDTVKQLNHFPSSKGNSYKKWEQYIPLLSNNWKSKIWITLSGKVRREFLCIYSLQNNCINWGFHTCAVSIFSYIYLRPPSAPRSLPFSSSSSSFSLPPYWVPFTILNCSCVEPAPVCGQPFGDHMLKENPFPSLPLSPQFNKTPIAPR